MKVQLRLTSSCLNKPEGSFFFIFMFLITVLSKVEVTTSERLTNAEWWWEQMERDSLALVVRYIKFLSLLVRMLFMRSGWKVIINHFCHCQKHFTNSLSTLRRTLASFFFQIEFTSVGKCIGCHVHNSRALQMTVYSTPKNNFYISKMH